MFKRYIKGYFSYFNNSSCFKSIRQLGCRFYSKNIGFNSKNKILQNKINQMKKEIKNIKERNDRLIFYRNVEKKKLMNWSKKLEKLEKKNLPDGQ